MADWMGTVNKADMNIYTTEYIDQDGGHKYMGRPIYAYDWATAEKVLRIMLDDMLAPPSMVIVGERKSISPTGV